MSRETQKRKGGGGGGGGGRRWMSSNKCSQSHVNSLGGDSSSSSFPDQLFVDLVCWERKGSRHEVFM